MEGQGTEDNLTWWKKTWIHSLSNRHRLQSWLGSQLNCGCKFCTISIHMEGL